MSSIYNTKRERDFKLLFILFPLLFGFLPMLRLGSIRLLLMCSFDSHQFFRANPTQKKTAFQAKEESHSAKAGAQAMYEQFRAVVASEVAKQQYSYSNEIHTNSYFFPLFILARRCRCCCCFGIYETYRASIRYESFLHTLIGWW